MRLLRSPTIAKPRTESDLERRVQQLVLMAKALAREIDTLQAELSIASKHGTQINFDKDGIDFYREVERYEIELITNALDLCGGNQAHAAKLLTMKPTTLNAKMKHYGLNSARSIIAQSR